MTLPPSRSAPKRRSGKAPPPPRSRRREQRDTCLIGRVSAIDSSRWSAPTGRRAALGSRGAGQGRRPGRCAAMRASRRREAGSVGLVAPRRGPIGLRATAHPDATERSAQRAVGISEQPRMRANRPFVRRSSIVDAKVRSARRDAARCWGIRLWSSARAASARGALTHRRSHRTRDIGRSSAIDRDDRTGLAVNDSSVHAASSVRVTRDVTEQSRWVKQKSFAPRNQRRRPCVARASGVARG
jgi:hypothetical protein